MFAGYPDHCVPLHNVEALSSNKYYLVGRMLAVCIVQSGATPSCFATAVADFIVWNHVKSPVCIDDIPDYDIQSCLKKVCNLYFALFKGSVLLA